MKLLPLLEEHYPSVAKIYLEGIATRNATFETVAPDWETWNKNHLKYCRFVAEVDNEIAGWAALTQVSGRCVYAGVAEVSEYVGEKFRGRGVGKFLLNEIIKQSEANGIWTLQAGLFPENIASMKLHEHSGFRVVGYREKVGKMGDI